MRKPVNRFCKHFHKTSTLGQNIRKKVFLKIFLMKLNFGRNLHFIFKVECSVYFWNPSCGHYLGHNSKKYVRSTNYQSETRIFLHNKYLNRYRDWGLAAIKRKGMFLTPVKHCPTNEISLNRFTYLNKPCVNQKLPVRVVWST